MKLKVKGNAFVLNGKVYRPDKNGYVNVPKKEYELEHSKPDIKATNAPQTTETEEPKE